MSNDLHIEIRPSQKHELELLQAEFSPHDFARHHYRRHAVSEKGEGVYLIAWHHDKPIGHFLLRWEGPIQDTSFNYPFPIPYLEAGSTRSNFRRKGVATQMIAEAENLVKAKGFNKIGLAVGSTDNPDAKRLYEKLGFKDWGKGEFTVSWDYQNELGEIGTESEVCIYMFKAL